MTRSLNRFSLHAQTHGLRWIERASARLRPKRQPPPHLATGMAGEREALLHLRTCGYTIVARRWTSAKLRGDLDLVAWKGDTLCFVEVKTRREQKQADPAEAAIDREKRRMLRRMARAYLHGFPRDRRDSIAVRFDIVAVYLDQSRPRFEIFPHAFGWRDPSGHSGSHFGV